MSMNLAILDGPDFPIQTPTNLTYEALSLGDKTEGDAMAKDALWSTRFLGVREGKKMIFGERN